LAKGAIVPLHNHVNEQVTMLETGAVRFATRLRRLIA
jgi:hypothetical protein